MTKINDRGRNARILLIDDNPGDVQLMRIAFAKITADLDLEIASSAEQGLDLLHKRGEHKAAERPDIVLLDLNLPRMNGHEFLRIVKTDSDLRRIPVVVLTSSCSESDVTTSYDRHANGYITKAFNLDGLVEIANKIEHYWFDLMQCPPDGTLFTPRAG